MLMSPDPALPVPDTMQKLTEQATAGAALYWALYYGHPAWIQTVFTDAPNVLCAAFIRAQAAFAGDVIGYQWTNPETGEKHMLSPHDVAIIRRSDR